jgi:hypothetical protein
MTVTPPCTLPPFANGTPMMCKPGTQPPADIEGPNAVYNYNSGKRYWYPNPETADSWGQGWHAADQHVVDCSCIPKGDKVPMKPKECSTIKCSDDMDKSRVYLFRDGTVYWYPNPAVASSWDPNWGTNVNDPTRTVPCNSFRSAYESHQRQLGTKPANPPFCPTVV